jgi:hypothetical protein
MARDNEMTPAVIVYSNPLLTSYEDDRLPFLLGRRTRWKQKSGEGGGREDGNEANKGGLEDKHRGRGVNVRT